MKKKNQVTHVLCYYHNKIKLIYMRFNNNECANIKAYYETVDTFNLFLFYFLFLH